MAVLAAERHRRITGEGQLVGLALKDVALAMLSHLGILGEVMVNGVDRPKYGNALYGAFGQDFPTADGRRIMIVALTPRQWTGLLAFTGLQARRRRSAGVWASPGAGRRSVQGAQGARGAVRPLVRRPAGRGVCRGFRRGRGHLIRFPLIRPGRSRGSGPFVGPSDVRAARAARGGRLPDPRPADRVRRLPARAPRPAPVLGEHTDEILAEVVGHGRRGDRQASRRGYRRRAAPLTVTAGSSGVAVGVWLIVAGVGLFAVMDAMSKSWPEPVRGPDRWARYAFAVPVILPRRGVPVGRRCSASPRPGFRRPRADAGAGELRGGGGAGPPAARRGHRPHLRLTASGGGAFRSSAGRAHLAPRLAGRDDRLCRHPDHRPPGLGAIAWAALYPLACAACFALFQLTTRLVGRRDPPAATLAWAILVGFVLTAPLLLLDWRPLSQRAGP